MSTLLERFKATTGAQLLPSHPSDPRLAHEIFYCPGFTRKLREFIEAESGMHREQARVADVAFQRVDQEKKILRKALQDLMDRHVDLVDSGDCGCWSAQEEPEVIAAKAALEQTTA